MKWLRWVAYAALAFATALSFWEGDTSEALAFALALFNYIAACVNGDKITFWKLSYYKSLQGQKWRDVKWDRELCQAQEATRILRMLSQSPHALTLTSITDVYAKAIPFIEAMAAQKYIRLNHTTEATWVSITEIGREVLFDRED